MAKSTKAQEVSTGTPDSYTEHELSDPAPPVVVTRAMLGEVPPSQTETDGGDSSTSSEKTKPSSDKSGQQGQKPAQNAESLSSQQGGPSTVLMTDGNGEETSQADEEDAYADWSYSDLQAECKERDLPAGGKKEELIARLVEDDENADSDEME